MLVKLTPVVVSTFVDGVRYRHPLLAALGLGDPGHDNDARVSSQHPALLPAHLDQLDGRRDVEEEQESQWQNGGEECVLSNQFHQPIDTTHFAKDCTNQFIFNGL
jgi:hypothetical protein